jgi:hypothetical protein
MDKATKRAWEAIVMQLNEMFPNVSLKELAQCVKKANGDIDQAVVFALELSLTSNETTSSKQEDQIVISPSSTPKTSKQEDQIVISTSTKTSKQEDQIVISTSTTSSPSSKLEIPSTKSNSTVAPSASQQTAAESQSSKVNSQQSSVTPTVSIPERYRSSMEQVHLRMSTI